MPLNQRSLPLKRASHLSPSRNFEEPPAPLPERRAVATPPSRGRTNSARTSRSRSPSAYRMSKLPSRFARSTSPLNQRNLPLKRASHLSPAASRSDDPPRRGVSMSADRERATTSSARTSSARTSRSRSPSSYRISNVPSRCAFSTVPLNQRSLPLKRASHLSPSRKSEEPALERELFAGGELRVLVRTMARTNSARTSRSRSPSSYRISNVPSRCAFSTVPLNQRNLPLKRASHLSPSRRLEEEVPRALCV